MGGRILFHSTTAHKKSRATSQIWQTRLLSKHRTVFWMDRSYGTPRSVDAVDPTSSYDAWPTLPSTRSISETSSRSRCFCCRLRLSWTAVSVVEIALMIVTVVAYYFLPKKFLERMLPPGTEVTEVSEWIMRTVGSMVSVQVRNIYNTIAVLLWIKSCSWLRN